MSPQLIEAARTVLRNNLGEAFAAKATDEFAVHYLLHESPQKEMALSEDIIPPPAAVNMVVEFDTQKQIDRQLSETSKHGDDRIKSVVDAVPEQELGSAAATAIKELQKISLIRRYREASLQLVQPANFIAEKELERSYKSRPDISPDQSSLTQYCWLNQTLKTLPDTAALAEMAHDAKVASIDLPHRLHKEINVTRTGIFASQYSLQFSRSGKGISIGVIDSEIFFDHPAFGGRAIRMENYTQEPWGHPDSHGTAVAGIIGADDTMYSGMAPEVKLFNYKVLATNELLSADDFGGSKAIEKALEDGMDIVNCSWGAGIVSHTLSREAKACNTAWNLGLTIVKSAGNRGNGPGTLTRPAEADGIIVVGATGKDVAAVQAYSSRGPIPSGSLRPHMVAPGGSQEDNMFSCTTNGSFGSVGAGTSFAAPHVTGLLALILEENPEFTNDDLRNYAIRLCTALQGFNQHDQGHGAISLRSLVP